MAKIGLIDVDRTRFPNLAMMKISCYHKNLGDQVEFVDPIFSGEYDKVYMSKIFTFTPDWEYPIIADEIERGGTGYNLQKVLPREIDRLQPDYSLYGVAENMAYGFLTRGCPKQIIPQWQLDLARWAMFRAIYRVCDFKDYEPRKGFKCKEYFK